MTTRPSGPHGDSLIVCVDFGSTFTKALLIDLDSGSVVAKTEHPTTLESDVLDGFDACLAGLAEADPGAFDARVLACSSAGGGLRIAVVGNEELVTAEAGRRVALSSGGKVVSVAAVAGIADSADLGDLNEPDVVLLTGGTDGGNSEVLLRAARQIVAVGWVGPVVVAGNVEACERVSAVLGPVPHVFADNVVPKIGVLAPAGARAAIREMFLSHVIGGKHLSARNGGEDFAAMVRGATPDVVLTGVELLAGGLDESRPGVGDVVVVDIGGATTDVHSVVELDPEDVGLSREVVATTRVTRTVEGDLGMRWSALSTVQAATPAAAESLVEAARMRTNDPMFLPTDAEGHHADQQVARIAAALAVRRHAGRSRVVVSPEGRVVERTGKDLRRVRVMIGSGGVLRHAKVSSRGHAEGHSQARVSEEILAGTHGPDPEGWQLPEAARVVVDSDYLLMAAGLLAAEHRDAAYALTCSLVLGADAHSLTE